MTTGTATTIYTVRFAEAVYVLHVFQKKSKKGKATPQADIELIRKRLKKAEEHYKTHYGKVKKDKEQANGTGARQHHRSGD